ncbi:molybdenum cofactor guanylyltransferase [Fulvivirgaceae bacterium PWU4]|uniref:Molybdenum cofactor guanylyltransferase n=1 Tax=Chryseosolibacter histidini TaxID=2782349 RepID=A0AAP2GHZ5_9BACT|nr:molybdenum cofactor guanylyltransferase [Chryseosolibacter histidini]MBT1696594.1 molybdenum cofactor guanylyltransferase [Chryseosolibacter histidini]
MDIASNLYGLVLSGGKSSRMGMDKGLISYHGKPQREHLFDLLSRCCARVFTSCNAEQQVPENLNPIVDQFDLQSPLNGILTAFKKFPDKAWLTVAVDMPYVDDHVLNTLIAHRDSNKVATCFYNASEKLPDPLLTIWEPAAYPLLLKFTEQGRISPRDFLSTHHAHMIHPPNDKTLLNINTPGDIPL